MPRTEAVEPRGRRNVLNVGKDVGIRAWWEGSVVGTGARWEGIGGGLLLVWITGSFIHLLQVLGRIVDSVIYHTHEEVHDELVNIGNDVGIGAWWEGMVVGIGWEGIQVELLVVQLAGSCLLLLQVLGRIVDSVVCIRTRYSTYSSQVSSMSPNAMLIVERGRDVKESCG